MKSDSLHRCSKAQKWQLVQFPRKTKRVSLNLTNVALKLNESQLSLKKEKTPMTASGCLSLSVSRFFCSRPSRRKVHRGPVFSAKLPVCV